MASGASATDPPRRIRYTNGDPGITEEEVHRRRRREEAGVASDLISGANRALKEEAPRKRAPVSRKRKNPERR